MTNNWIFFQIGVDIHIYMGLLSTRHVPPRGALEAFKCAGQPKAVPEMRRLAFGVSPGQYSGGADAVALFGATRHRVRRPKPCGPRGAKPRSTSDQWRFLCIWCITSGAMPRHKGLSNQRWIGALPERVGA